MTERDLTLASGLRLRLAEAGSGAAVVLVHGNFASRRWWGDLLADPPAGLRLLAPDLPNFGASDPLPDTQPITMPAYAEALGEALDALNLQRAVLVGHSLGATVVQHLAVRTPERVAGLLLMDGAPPHGLPRPEAELAALAAFVGRRDLLDAALAAMRPTRVPSDWDAYLDDALAMAERAYQGNARALASDQLPPAPGGFDAPVLVLRGGLDPLILPEMATATAGHWQGARLTTWPEVGHSPQVEDPPRFAALLASFTEEAAMD